VKRLISWKASLEETRTCRGCEKFPGSPEKRGESSQFAISSGENLLETGFQHGILGYPRKNQFGSRLLSIWDLIFHHVLAQEINSPYSTRVYFRLDNYFKEYLMKVVVALSLVLNLFTKPGFTQPGFTCSQLIGESEHVGFQLPDEFTNQLPG